MNTLETLTTTFAATFNRADKVDLDRARLAYAGCASDKDGGLGISTRDFAAAVATASGRGFKQSTVARLVSGYRLPLDAGVKPTAENVGLALSVLNNGRQVGKTFTRITAATVAVSGDEATRSEYLSAALRSELEQMRIDAANRKGAVIDAAADKVAAMLTPNPVGDDREASDTGVSPVPASLDTLLAAVAELTGRIASGEFPADANVWQAFDALSDALASVPALA